MPSPRRSRVSSVDHVRTGRSPDEPSPSQSAHPFGDVPADPTGLRLVASRLVLGYGGRVAVNDVSVALRSGRVTALVGPNGSGKSTLLRSMARLHPVGGGGIVLRGGLGLDAPAERPVSTLSAREFAREVTLFAQSRAAPHGLSVREVVGFGRHPYRRRFSGLSEDDRAAVERALQATGITTLADRAAGELSGGELQRVWLATCLAQETDVVLLDEPTNHLDLRYQVETLELIRDLADDRGAAVGVVLHDLDHAAHVADHLVLMAAGRILAAGSPGDVLTAANITEAYQLPVEVHLDERTRRLRIDPISRHSSRTFLTTSTDDPPSPIDQKDIS